MNCVKYLWYDIQTKLFVTLFVLFLVAFYFIVAITFPGILPLFPFKAGDNTIDHINNMTINLLYSTVVSIFTYFLTISIPTFIRLLKGYLFLKIHFKNFLDSWVCLYCLLKYSLLITSDNGNKDIFVKLYEIENLEQIEQIVKYKEFQVWNNANNFIINIEHFFNVLSKNENNIPTSLYLKISSLDCSLLPTIKWELGLLRDLSLCQVSSSLKQYEEQIDKFFSILKQCEILFIGKSLMKQSNLISDINVISIVR